MFLDDCARRPALRMAWRVSSGRGSGENVRMARLVRMAVWTERGLKEGDVICLPSNDRLDCVEYLFKFIGREHPKTIYDSFGRERTNLKSICGRRFC